MSELSKFVTEDLASTTKIPGEYRNDVDDIPVTDRTIESAMPKGPDPSPFALGPLRKGE